MAFEKRDFTHLEADVAVNLADTGDPVKECTDDDFAILSKENEANFVIGTDFGEVFSAD